MATSTANYNLRKPAGGDLVTVASDLNASMDTIDTELKGHADRLTALEVPTSAFIIKTADQARTNNTNFLTDDTLNYTFPSVGTYILEWYLIVSGSETADINLRLTWTAALTTYPSAYGLISSAANASDFSRTDSVTEASISPSTFSTFGTLLTLTSLIVRTVAVVTGVGDMDLQFTQNVANATPTTILKGSTLEVRKVA